MLKINNYFSPTVVFIILAKRYKLCFNPAFWLGVLSLFSCSSKKENADNVLPSEIVINEIMPLNRTGLTRDDGGPADWIELKNEGDSTVNLEGYVLALTKLTTEVDSQTVKWKFPTVDILSGGYIVVFADKDKKSKKTVKVKSLTANFNLPKEGGELSLLSPLGDTISSVTYRSMEPDVAYARLSDGSYETTYWQSPGFENTREGYLKAWESIESQREDPIKIWELMSRAEHSYQNWVELKNTGDTSVNLANYSIAKKYGKKEGWNLPDKVLKPGEFFVVQLAGKRLGDKQKAPFKLGDKEAIVLMNNGKFVDGMNAKPTFRGGSVGRMDDEKGIFYFSHPSREAANTRGGKRFIADRPCFDKVPDTYPEDSVIVIHLVDPNRKVRYTTDGSVPTSASRVMKDSLVITRPTVIRAFAEGDASTHGSSVKTMTYIPGISHDLAVMCITANNDDLYGFERGIYSQGPGYDNEWPHLGANYWKNWTRDAHVEFFDNHSSNEGFSTDCGLKIFGGYSRFEDKKSFRLKFRGKYGDAKVEYDFFDKDQPIEIEDLVVRSGSQDWNRCMIRDEFFTSLMQEQSPELLTQMYRPVALYVNAEYFGLYYLREKIDKNFVARKLDVPDDSISIIFSNGNPEAGSNSHYKKIMEFVKTKDLTDADNYKFMADNVDLQGLIDYKIGEIYSSNTDVGNIRYVRSTSSKGDRKWHFVFYDLDATWVGLKPGAEFYLATGETTTGVSEHNVMINRLLANKDFRKLFLQRLSHHLTNTFSAENANARLDALLTEINSEMERNCARWPQLTHKTWEKNISDFRGKFDKKPQVMLDDLRSFLHITEDESDTYFGQLGY